MFMEINSQIGFLVGDAAALEEIQYQKGMIPFSEKSITFLAELSDKIREANKILKMPDIEAFAFWCRRSHLESMMESYGRIRKERLGRGVSFHIVPSNMPVLFAFSLAAGILSGTSVILRMPEKMTKQAECICACIIRLCEKNPMWSRRIVILQYQHQQEITEKLSSICHVRIIWGGDKTVKEIRKIPLPPRALEIPFSDRKSAAVLDAEAVIQEKEMAGLAYGFYQDTFQQDQAACSSPSLVYWLGKKKPVMEAQEKFWSEIGKYAEERYSLQPETVMKKWEQAFFLAAKYDTIKIVSEKNYILRLQTPVLENKMWEEAGTGGFFWEASGQEITALFPMMSPKCQTITVFGIKPEMLRQKMLSYRTQGPDRIVPIGQALNFSLVWDGMDMIEMLTRKLNLE